MPPKLELRVEGKKYSGWQRVSVSRGIEALCGSFSLAVSDRWGTQSEPWPIRKEDECAVLLDGLPVITGYVDKVSPSYDAKGHSLSVSGKDKTSALVECSANIGKWEFVNTPLQKLAEKLCEPYGIQVLVQSGLSFPSVAKLSIDPGESPFQAIERACRLAGALPVSDHGDLLLTRAGASRATTDLVEGENILEASGDFDATGRFRTYHVLGQCQGSDDIYGAQAASVKGEAQDSTVRREERTLLVRAEGNVTKAQAKLRAEWEAIVRAGRGDTVEVTVQGWQQGNGELWPVNALVRLKSPMLGIDSDMLITEATYTLDDDSGTLARLSLKRPDAFKPEPVVQPVSKGLFLPELAGGV